METYKPTQRDLRWTNGLIDTIADGGVYGWPAIRCIFSVNKVTQTFTLFEWDTVDPNTTANLSRFKAALAACGYKLIIPADYR